MMQSFGELAAGLTLIIGAAALLRWLARTPTQHEGTHGRPACPGCGYATSDLVPLACPECGDYLGVIADPAVGRRTRWARVIAGAALFTLLLGGGGALVAGPARELLCITRCDASVSIVPPSHGLARPSWARIELRAGSWRLGTVTPPPPADWVTIEIQLPMGHTPGGTIVLEGARTREGWLLQRAATRRRFESNRDAGFQREVAVGPADLGAMSDVLKAVGVKDRDESLHALGAIVLENLVLLHADGSKASTGPVTGARAGIFAAANAGCVVGMPAWIGRAGMVTWGLGMLAGWFWILWRGR